MASPVKYRVGIDVGLRSIGFAAVEVDDDGTPVRLLNCMSLIHDAGLDPDSQKNASTRRMTSGVARRTRRMYRERKQRLEALDKYLQEQGFPLAHLDVSKDKAGWKARARLATEPVADQEELAGLISDAMRHLARHRGWRNPYTGTNSLMNRGAAHSEAFLAMQEKFAAEAPDTDLRNATLAQMVMALPDGTKRLRGEDGLLSERLHQRDYALEIFRIAEVQGLSESLTKGLIEHVFAAKSPKGSAAGRVGNDVLDSRYKRAWRAERAFQEYRIISLLANVRVLEESNVRPLSVSERQSAFEFLNTWTDAAAPTWNQVAEVIGIDRGKLRGTASSNDDGERVSAAPPVNETERTMATTKIKEFKKFWKKASDESKDALLHELSNVDTPPEETPAAVAASQLVRGLPEESLEKLESLRLPDGRSPYSVQTLSKLRDYMLANEADLHQARKEVYGVDDAWAPPAEPIGAPTGNPAVDRVLKATNRWLMLAEKRWGKPVSINVESLRDGFKSESMAREIEREQAQRAKRNQQNIESMQKKLGYQGTPRRSEVLRFQAIQRQNGQCAYCGSPIDFKTSELDHIVPRAGAGSTSTRVNLLAACHRCNLSKGKLPFAVWAKQSVVPGVSVKEAIDRVRQWSTDPGLNAKQMSRFKQEVIFRLKRVTADEEIDARSRESVSWMANELRHRIQGHFGEETRVRVFRGEVTWSARKAAGIEDQLRMIGGRSGKNRLDRRHHAVDAAVIALMQAMVAQVLAERNSLRSQEHVDNRPDPQYGSWRKYQGKTPEERFVYQAWLKRMGALVPMLQKALDNDDVPVVENLRLRFGNGLAHEESIGSLTWAKLGSEIPMEQLDRASSPALWTALSRCADFEWGKGLPANPERRIVVNGTHYGPEDEISFFPVKAGAIQLNNGYVELGSAFHHARLYRIKGSKSDTYAMVRVYTVDLVRHQKEDLFTVDLPPQSMSMRQAEMKLRTAIRDGNAEYVTWFVVGDELDLDAQSIATGQAKEFLAEYGEVRRWRIKGLFTPVQLRLKPAQLAAEGLTDDTPPNIRKVVNSPGWLPAVNKVFGAKPVIVRRDAHGRPRLQSGAGLPVSQKTS